MKINLISESSESTDNPPKPFLEIPDKSLISGSAAIALTVAVINGAATWFTDNYVTKPQNDREFSLEEKKFLLDEELKKQTQLLEQQKFQSELLQSALQEANPKQRAQALRMLVDMKLLNISPSLIDDFIKNPNTVPQLSPQSTGKPKAPSTSVSGKPITSK
jgi:hypothetical protein